MLLLLLLPDPALAEVAAGCLALFSYAAASSSSSSIPLLCPLLISPSLLASSRRLYCFLALLPGLRAREAATVAG